MVKATPPDASRRFVLYPVPTGTYDLVVTASGRVTAVMTGVPVITTAYTFVNSETVPIAPAAAASAARSVTGVVNPASATVRVMQTLTGGPRIEVAWAPVDALNGSFGVTLPVSAPAKTIYTPNPTVLNFTADAAIAGRYQVEASSAGVVKSQDIDTNAVVPPLSFVFP